MQPADRVGNETRHSVSFDHMGILMTVRVALRSILLVTATVFAAIGSIESTHAGEWMFRLKDAHIQLRKALRTRDAELAWECVNRPTRQQAGILAGRIRDAFDQLSDDNKSALKQAIGTDDEAIVRSIHGRDLLVAPFFIEAHAHVLAPDRDESRLKEHGTRMALPTAIVVNRKLPDEKLVVYTFSTEGHFGGQAMDYRAQLEVPSLDEILGPTPELPGLSAEETEREALKVFSLVQDALRNKDVEALWPLLDCVSHSQASHFADQAHERAFKPKKDEKLEEEIADKLGITVDELKELDGKRVWSLPWATSDFAFLIEGTDAEYLSAESYDHKLLPIPEGYKRRDKPKPPEPVIQFKSQDRLWQIPARLNYRDGTPKITLFLRSPFYLRLRK